VQCNSSWGSEGETYKKERGDVLGLDGYMGESIEIVPDFNLASDSFQ
jgi:hypothetical protein